MLTRRYAQRQRESSFNRGAPRHSAVTASSLRFAQMARVAERSHGHDRHGRLSIALTVTRSRESSGAAAVRDSSPASVSCEHTRTADTFSAAHGAPSIRQVRQAGWLA